LPSPRASGLADAGARKLARLLRSRKVSAVEVMRAFIERIEAVNPKLKAIVTFRPEEALKEARRAKSTTPLAGLPVAYKDMIVTKGIRTTFGSPIYADNVPNEDHLIVERLKAAGAITLGKTNTPEFAAGSQTFNPVFGTTRNPWDLDKTCGGSSGGAAVAVACGMLPFADGSDLGGSLRNPGNFNNVVGFRPTVGRVPYYPAADTWQTMSVIGPIARTVDDAAFLLSLLAGPDPRSPVCIDEPGSRFARTLARDFKRVRVAWWRPAVPTDKRVTAVLEKQRKVFESLGCIVEDIGPDLTGADEVFRVFRANSFAMRYGDLLAKHRDKMKDTVIWNTEEGLKLDGPRIGRAIALRSDIPAHARIHGALRIPLPPGEPGAAVRRRRALREGDRRREAGDVHRLDEDLLSHHRHGPSGDLGAGGLHRRCATPAGGPADRRPLQGRFRRAADGARLRAGDAGRRRAPAPLMGKGRLEAFSDGVIAVIITIMVLELKVPHGAEVGVLAPLIPVFLTYVLSFVYVAIYWNNHHHLLHSIQHVTGGILWANTHLLFWLSLVPFVTGWMSENHFEPIPVALYGFVLMCSGIAYYILTHCLMATHGRDSEIARSMGSDFKGKISVVMYGIAIASAFVSTWISGAIYVAVAAMWLVPDRRLEHRAHG
jgi:amidase